MLERFAIYKRIKDDIDASSASKKEKMLWDMTLDYGLKMTETKLAWLQAWVHKV